MDSLKRMPKIKYDRIIETQGVKVPVVAEVISDRMVQVMEKGRYEAGEVKLLRKILRPNDTVLELGAGVGVVSCVAAFVTTPDRVTVVEANPYLVPVIRETHRLN